MTARKRRSPILAVSVESSQNIQSSTPTLTTASDPKKWTHFTKKSATLYKQQSSEWFNSNTDNLTRPVIGITLSSELIDLAFLTARFFSVQSTTDCSILETMLGKEGCLKSSLLCFQVWCFSGQTQWSMLSGWLNTEQNFTEQETKQRVLAWK